MSPITIIVAIVITEVQDTGTTHIHTTMVILTTHTTLITIMAIHTVHTSHTTVLHITINHKKQRLSSHKHNNKHKMEPSVLLLHAIETLSVTGVVRGALSV